MMKRLTIAAAAAAILAGAISAQAQQPLTVGI